LSPAPERVARAERPKQAVTISEAIATKHKVTFFTIAPS
jgi:hypothetical protein